MQSAGEYILLHFTEKFFNANLSHVYLDDTCGDDPDGEKSECNASEGAGKAADGFFAFGDGEGSEEEDYPDYYKCHSA